MNPKTKADRPPEDMNPPDNRAKIDAKRAGRLKTCPSSWRGALTRSWTKPSRKSAITAFCGECVGFDRQAVRDCTAYACPLWEHRPFVKPDDSTDLEEIETETTPQPAKIAEPTNT